MCYFTEKLATHATSVHISATKENRRLHSWLVCLAFTSVALYLHAGARAFGASVLGGANNPDFLDAGNVGTVGGGLILGASGSNVPIGVPGGPWNGTFNGVLSGSLGLIPPSLQISNGPAADPDPPTSPDNGFAKISGVTNISILGLGLLSNGGFFSQTLSQNYAPNTIYTLGVEVDSDSLLGLSVGVLNTGNAGIALTNGSSILSSNVTPAGGLITIAPIIGGANLNELTLQFTTGSIAPTGAIGIRLFDQPTAGLTLANILGSITFSDVTLDATPVPEPASLGLAGFGLIAFGWTVLHRRRDISKRCG